MKRTALAIAVGSLSLGLSNGLLAEEEDSQQPMTEEQSQQEEKDQRIETQDQASEQGNEDDLELEEGELGDQGVQDSEFTDQDSEEGNQSQDMDGQDSPAQEDAPLRNGDASAQDDSLMSLQASDLEGRDVVNQDGDELGEVDQVARNTQTDELHAIVSEGGFLGIGTDEYSVPLNELQVQDDDEVVLQGNYSEDELEQYAESYDADNFEELDDDESLSDAQNQGDGDF